MAQIAEAMAWASHSVRGLFAGLKKRHGISVIPTEHVRQIGSEGHGKPHDLPHGRDELTRSDSCAHRLGHPSVLTMEATEPWIDVISPTFCDGRRSGASLSSARSVLRPHSSTEPRSKSSSCPRQSATSCCCLGVGWSNASSPGPHGAGDWSWITNAMPAPLLASMSLRSSASCSSRPLHSPPFITPSSTTLAVVRPLGSVLI